MKRALIVDDSKTAQFKLKKILDIYQLQIDFASSAEDALSYLSYQIPDIIFMDHSMQGMDGLEAVKIIKSNPATAIIPVVMYTAEKGDVYLGQARAIGALDVISKDVMVASDIKRVMKSVNIDLIRRDSVDQKQPSNLRPISPTILDPENQSNTSQEFDDIRKQVTKGLRLQQSQISRDIQDNTRLLTRRFMHELKNMQAEIKQDKRRQQELIQVLGNRERPSKRPSLLWGLIPLLILLAFTAVGMHEISELKRDNEMMRSVFREVATELANQNNAVLDGLDNIERSNSEQSRIRSEELLTALVWAVNKNGQYEFPSQALGDDRISLVSGLMNFLDKAQFRGTMTLGIHSGNFCVVTDQSGQFVLPQDSMSLGDCELLSNYDRDLSSAAQTSTSFIDFLNTSPVVASGNLKINIQTYGVGAPSYEYPDYNGALSVSDWNEIAAANNRLIVSLSPD